MDAIELSIFASRLSAICDEMGAQLVRAAFSPNIRDRLDFSCAIFDRYGELCAQAAHIPVHLGSMAYAMRDIVSGMQWQEGDSVILNDPYLGGTHLPDVTFISPFFCRGEIVGFVANRAHHADIGADSPGSMPISRNLDEEGVLITPQYIARKGNIIQDVYTRLTQGSRNAGDISGDFTAQMSANGKGIRRLHDLVNLYGLTDYLAALAELNAYAERLAQTAVSEIPDGQYRFEDRMDDDGMGSHDIRIQCSIEVEQGAVSVNFEGTAAQVEGNINCPISVTAAGVLYAFRCLMPPQTPACAGSFRPISIRVPDGCLLNARRPAAVAAGNVETSSRVVDVVLGALSKAVPERIPAASQGTMNNLAMGQSGDCQWGYYETIAGGMGAGPKFDGLSARQSHMTNTRNTPIEVLEMRYPLRVSRYAIRRGSGGSGQHRGGDGLIREYEFLQPAQISLLTERRSIQPWGLNGGECAVAGINRLNDEVLPPKVERQVFAGDHLCIETPGGGGWGSVNDS